MGDIGGKLQELGRIGLHQLMRSGRSAVSTHPAAPAPGRRDAEAPTAQLYSVLIDLLRDQIAAQLESASTNDLKAVAAIAAALAIVVGMLVLKVTDTSGALGSWWWWPMPLFPVPTIIIGIPLMPGADGKDRPPGGDSGGRRSKRTFKDGPHVPTLLRRFAESPVTLDGALIQLIKELQRTWQLNDRLLARERACMFWGLVGLAVSSAVTVGLYTWALS